MHKIGYHTQSQLIQITLSPQSLTELGWWTSPDLTEHNKMSLQPPPIDKTITTEASTKRGGAVCLETRTGGQWSSSEAMLHINYLELNNSDGAHKQEGRNTFIKANSIGPRYLDILSVTSMWRWIIHLDISTTAQSGR